MQRSLSARGDRLALHAVQIGALAVVLAALPYKAFDLDRFFVPKELVLHLTAAIAAFACLVRRRRLEASRVDVLLALYLLVSLASAALATNWWAAWRGLAISVSGIAIFWVARALRHAGHGRAVTAGIVLAAAVGAGTALVQAYGFDSEYFSLNRAPGGTFGNRNFVAHVAAIVTPLVLLFALTARRAGGFLLSLLALVALSGMLILSRSRAAWLALAAALGVVFVAGWLVRSRWNDPRLGRRLFVAGVAVAASVAAAIVLPNRLEWRSDNPYLESAIGLVNYREGSGHGRLIQYRNSMKMAMAHPVLGVGPGNWAVVYPKYASRNDPSLTDDDMTANPWPSSDWVAFVSERGFAGAALLLLAFVGLGFAAIGHLRSARNAEQVAAALALGGTLVATIAVGAFDAVLLIGAPSLLVWALLGALAEPARSGHLVFEKGVRELLPGAIVLFGLLAAGASAMQAAAMGTYSAGPDRIAMVDQARLLYPGNYRIRVKLAELYLSRGRCDRARGVQPRRTRRQPTAQGRDRLARRRAGRVGVARRAPGPARGVPGARRRIRAVGDRLPPGARADVSGARRARAARAR